MRALELFSGIGGFAAAVADSEIHVAAAYDQNPNALAVYRLNFPDHHLRSVDLERISAWELTSCNADLWWLSPPCQPYCERGVRRDLEDPRAKSLIHLLDLLGRIPDDRLPQHIALENVAGFQQSDARKRLLETLQQRCYNLQERLLCPTELGVPSRRPRYYLMASQIKLGPLKIRSAPLTPLVEYLDLEYRPDLLVEEDVLQRFVSGLRILDPTDQQACTTCFISGYGKSIVNAGSYLKVGQAVRRFAPEEIARLLHLPNSFRFPEEMSLRQKWHLVGNSLSVKAVQTVLGAFPEVKLAAGAEKEKTLTHPGSCTI